MATPALLAARSAHVPAVSGYTALVGGLTGLKQFLKLDEPSGTTAADSSGNGNTGTYEANVLLNQSGPFTGSKAITMDGSEGKVSSTYNPFSNARTTSFGGWANRTDTSGTNRLIGKAGIEILFQVNGGAENVAFDPGNPTNAQAWVAAWPGLTQWVFWGLEFDPVGNTQKLYIAGSLVSSLAQTSDWDTTAGDLNIGCGQHAFHNVWKGSLYGWFVVEGSVGATNWAALAAATSA